jgi:predicted small metal-binding protein
MATDGYGGGRTSDGGADLRWRERRCVMRKVVDCRDVPSESKCTLAISGEEDEVVRAAAEHAASVHGHADSPELRKQIRSTLKDEVSQHA